MKPLFLSLLTASSLLAADKNWPEFRGPRGDGISTAAKLPLKWSEQQNVAWKTEIHDKGWSSPVIWGDQVWVTTANDGGRRLYAVCLDRNSGKVIHDLLVFEADQPDLWKRYNSYASPTPVIEKGRIYLSFGEAGTACLDTRTGKKLWERRDLKCNHFRGAGSSPILHQGLLYLNFDGSDRQFMVALDAKTGATRWQKDRSVDYKDLGANGKPEADGDMRKAFATCAVTTVDGIPHLVTQGAKAVYGLDARDGRELWRVEERTSHSAGTRPAIGHGLVFVPSGWSQGQTLAIRPNSAGTVLDANVEPAPAGGVQLAWKSKRGTPKKPSLTLVGDLLFGVEDGGVANCWEATTGKLVWSERLGGNYSASPLATQDRLYCFSESGTAVVIAADRTFRRLADNQLDGGCMASPAAAGEALWVRTQTHLYRIEDRH
jgi:outer membrane protein assembly factor BamB